MVKLGAQQLAKPEVVTKGKLVQQVGVKPSPKVLRERAATRAEVDRQRAELKATQQKLGAISIEDYEREYSALPDWQKKYFITPAKLKQTSTYKKYITTKQSYQRQQQFYSRLNAQLRTGAYAESPPAGLSASEKKIWQQAMDKAASRGVYAAKYEKYPKGKVYYETAGGELVTTLKTTDIGAKLVAVKLEEAKVKKEVPEIEIKGDVAAKEYYLPGFGDIGAFGKVSGVGPSGTMEIRGPTIEEYKKIQEVEYKGELIGGALTALPRQYVGGFFETPLGTKDILRISDEPKKKYTFGILSPPKQWDIYKTSFETRKEAEKAGKLVERHEKLKVQFEAEEISEGEFRARERNIIEDPVWKKLRARGEITSYLKLYGELEESKWKKRAVGATIGTAQVLPYFTPIGRILFGGVTIGEGAQRLMKEDITTKEKWIGTGQIALGGALVYSGFRGFAPSKTAGLQITSPLAKPLFYTAGLGLAGGIGYISYKQTLKTTGSPEIALGKGIGVGGTIGAAVIGPSLIRVGRDWWVRKQAPLGELKTPPITRKPFIKKEGIAGKRAVYYERVPKGGAKWYKPTTWEYKGREPGTFYQREYKWTPSEVELRFLGKKEGFAWKWDIKTGTYKYVKVKATTFPVDLTKTHKAWFQKVGPKEYYIPMKALPKGFAKEFYTQLAKGKGAIGVHATGKAWGRTMDVDPYIRQYLSGKGASLPFFRMGEKYTVRVGIGGGVTGGRPQLQIGYIKDIRITPALYEQKLPSYFGLGKGAKRYILKKPDIPGVADIPLYKQEVEAVITGGRKVFPPGYYRQFGGRTIKITPQTYVPYTTPPPTPTPTPGVSIADASSSFIPTSYIELPIGSYAFISSKPEISYPYKPSLSLSTPSSVASSISSYFKSSISAPSYPSVSYPSAPSYSISAPSYPSYPSYAYTPPTTPYYPSTTTTIIPPTYFKPKAPRRRVARLKAPREIVRRRPSLWALGEQIRMPKPRRFEVSGLVLRPIVMPNVFALTKRRRKKKRR